MAEAAVVLAPLTVGEREGVAALKNASQVLGRSEIGQELCEPGQGPQAEAEAKAEPGVGAEAEGRSGGSKYLCRQSEIYAVDEDCLKENNGKKLTKERNVNKTIEGYVNFGQSDRDPSAEAEYYSRRRTNTETLKGLSRTDPAQRSDGSWCSGEELAALITGNGFEEGKVSAPLILNRAGSGASSTSTTMDSPRYVVDLEKNPRATAKRRHSLRLFRQPPESASLSLLLSHPRSRHDSYMSGQVGDPQYGVPKYGEAKYSEARHVPRLHPSTSASASASGHAGEVSKSITRERKGSSIATESSGEGRTDRSPAASTSSKAAYEYILPTTSPFYRHVVSPACDWICRNLLPARLTPNQITVMGLCFALLALTLIRWEFWRLGALAWMCYSICDNLDGKQARYRQLSSAAGEFLDHTVDSAVSTMLALIFVSAFLPQTFHSVHSVADVFAYAVILGMSQIPFYIGCWAYHAIGRLVIGAQSDPTRRDYVTVDEINLIVVPAMAFLRHSHPNLFFQPLETFAKTHNVFDLLAPLQPRLTTLSFYVPAVVSQLTAAHLLAIAGVFTCCCTSLTLVWQLWTLSLSHILIALGVYVSTILLMRVPPILLLPFFTWLCSALIFSKAIQRYFENSVGRSVWKRFLEYRLPEIHPWQVQKRYPLFTLLAVSFAFTLIPTASNQVYLLTLIVSNLAVAGVVVTDVLWLTTAEAEVRKHTHHALTPSLTY